MQIENVKIALQTVDYDRRGGRETTRKDLLVFITVHKNVSQF